MGEGGSPRTHELCTPRVNSTLELEPLLGTVVETALQGLLRATAGDSRRVPRGVARAESWDHTETLFTELLGSAFMTS